MNFLLSYFLFIHIVSKSSENKTIYNAKKFCEWSRVMSQSVDHASQAD